MDLLIKSYPGYFTFFGQVEEQRIVDEEKKLGVKFPESYRKFLLNYGCASFSASSFEGIGIYSSVTRCTERMRKHINIPNELIYILSDDEEIYLLDTSQMINYECPVVKYDLEAQGEKLRREPVSPSFGDFFIERFLYVMREVEKHDE
jgi:hypothetical protein